MSEISFKLIICLALNHGAEDHIENKTKLIRINKQIKKPNQTKSNTITSSILYTDQNPDVQLRIDILNCDFNPLCGDLYYVVIYQVIGKYLKFKKIEMPDLHFCHQKYYLLGLVGSTHCTGIFPVLKCF